MIGDGIVNFSDLTMILDFWRTDNPFGDANRDGIVNFVDITTISGNWLTTCP